MRWSRLPSATSICPTGRLPTPPTGYRTASMRRWPERRKGAGGHPAPCVRPRPDTRTESRGAFPPCQHLTSPRALPARARPTARTLSLFDKALTGFGLRIHPSGRKVYIVQARIEGPQPPHRHRPARRNGACRGPPPRPRHARPHPPRAITPLTTSRKEKETPTLRAFAGRISAPLRAALEVLRAPDHAHLPQGPHPARVRQDAARCPSDRRTWPRGFDAASRDKPGAANRAFEILRAMMFRAEEWGLRERGSNPCLGIAKNPRNNVARFLDADELARLGRALDANEARWPEAVAAIRLLALTGCRRSEVLDLRWRNIGEDAIALEDSKTGPARRAARRGSAGAHCRAARRARSGCVPVPAPRRRQGHLQPCNVLADSLRRCRARQAAPARPAPHGGQSCCDGGREPAVGWEAARDIGGTGPRRATPTLTMTILSKQRKKSGA